MSKYELALDYAAKKHSGKYRKGIPKKPYIIHPVNVSKLIEKYMGDDENIEDLKNEILETCIKVYNTPILTSDGDEYDNDAIYDKIQQLFKEGE